MTDAQLISLVIALAVTPLATLTVVLLGKASEQRYIKAESERLDSRITLEFQAAEAKAETRRQTLSHRIDNMENAILARVADLDGRLQKLEAK
ncbi:MAG: hypothetical protein ACRD7E_25530 [Bryobacteraceae bacterium]